MNPARRSQVHTDATMSSNVDDSMRIWINLVHVGEPSAGDAIFKMGFGRELKNSAGRFELPLFVI
jgi:hypothetical protein